MVLDIPPKVAGYYLGNRPYRVTYQDITPDCNGISS